MPAHAQPIWWATLGPQLGIDTGRLSEVRGTEAGVVIGTGVYVLRLGAVLLGVEAEGAADRVKENLKARNDSIDIWRARLGIRAAWWEEHEEPLLVPYARGGGAYRADRATRRDDDGVGWYLGAGLDLRLGEHWALGPFVTYEEVALRERTKALLLGLGLTFSY